MCRIESPNLTRVESEGAAERRIRAIGRLVVEQDRFLRYALKRKGVSLVPMSEVAMQTFAEDLARRAAAVCEA